MGQRDTKWGGVCDPVAHGWAPLLATVLNKSLPQVFGQLSPDTEPDKLTAGPVLEHPATGGGFILGGRGWLLERIWLLGVGNMLV